MSKAIPTRSKGDTDTAYIERVFAAIYGSKAKRVKPSKPVRAARGPEVDIVRLKRAMVAFAQAHDVKIPAEFALTTAWGPGAQTLAWRVSGRLEKAQTKVDGKLLVQTGKPLMVLVKALKA